jgi:nucleotidyltransferase/DNA polymerase involved in DNA repair
MVRIAFRPPPGRRIIGPYVWEKSNGWVQDVDPWDILEILTNPGFSVAETDDLTLIRGIGPRREEELLLVGVVTYRQLTELDPEQLVAQMGSLSVEQVREWQASARALLEQGASDAPDIEEAQ